MYYHAVEDLNKQIFPQTQYLQSIGTIIPKDGGGDVSVYFFPFLAFPNHTELVSLTLLSKHQPSKKSITFVIAENGSEEPVPVDYKLTQSSGNLVSILNFPQPLILDPFQPFFFYHNEKLEDSCVVLGYKNFTGKFGPQYKTSQL